MGGKYVYHNYIFDLYGTLVDIHTDEEKPYLWKELSHFYGSCGANYTYEELKREYLRLCKEEEEKLPEKKYPEIEITSVFRRLFQLRSVEADTMLAVHASRLFRRLSLEYIHLYDGVTELLDHIRQEGKRLFLLSNAQRIFTEPEMRSLRIYDKFDGIILSSDEGVKKPSEKFYRILLDRYQINPGSSIMIGNDPVADILGAKKAGLDTLYFHSNISPELLGEVDSTYSVMDKNVHKIGKLILKKDTCEGWDSLTTW